MTQAKKGDTVRVHYTGMLEDGTVFDTSLGREPLEFTIGESEIIPGFEDGVIGMQPGETKTFKVASERAFGPHREELVITMDRDQFPPHLHPEVGKEYQMRQPDGNLVPVRVVEVSEETVTLDANHPLAGKDLIFEVQLLEVL
ncbi:MAG: peptidylprolyl isomerase [Candidatus Latescibacterota bacterium]|nr:MAG: peptidylprolyl isomerase [Candidatus Latescibacterota bacterium]